MIRGVEIKKLNWEGTGYYWGADTPFGPYNIRLLGGSAGTVLIEALCPKGASLFRGEVFGKRGNVGLDTDRVIDEARAVCQNHFDRTILSLITFVVEPTPEELERDLQELLHGDGREDGFDGFFEMVENKTHQALIDLLSWSPELTGPDEMPWAEGMGETADRWARVPFLTETFLYSTLGKDDARSLLTRMDKTISSLGIDPFEFRLDNGLFPFIKQ